MPTHPPKILHVANFMTRFKGASYFANQFKFSNGLVRAGCNVLNFSDRDVARASSLFRNRKAGAAGANRRLLDLAAAFRPDIILFGHADTIEPTTLDRLREACPGVKLVQWNVDPLFEPDNVARLNAKIAHVDLTFVTTSGPELESLGQHGRYRVAFVPNPVDPGIERSRAFEHPRDALAHDLFYAVGRASLRRFHAGREQEAGEIVKNVIAACPDVRGLFPGYLGQPLVAGYDYERVLAQSAMGLNISRRNDSRLYSSDRIAHLAGSGILVFLDRATGYTDLFAEDEIAFYSSEDEMHDKIRRFAREDDARRAAAQRGFTAYSRFFDATKIARYMLGVIDGSIDAGLHDWTR